MWQGTRYGSGIINNDVKDSCEVLANLNYKILNIIGIAKTVKAGWQQLHNTFRAFGLLNSTTEQLIERLNVRLQKYPTSAALSQKLDASFCYLQLKLGTNTSPFDLLYKKL